MGKKFFSEVLSIGSDILAAVTGQPEIAIAGNAAGGGIEGGLKGALLGGGTAFLGSEVLGPELSKIIGVSPLGSAPFSLDPGAGAALGSAAGGAGGQLLAGKVVEPQLAKLLGMTGGGATSAPAAPALANTPSTATPTGGPGLAAGIPGGLNISGSTAPQIAPWFKPDKLPGAP